MRQDHIRRTLLTYSLVNYQFQGNRDPIAALSPFFTPIAIDRAGQPFDATDFRGEMNRRYGLSFSRDVTEAFVARLLSLGFLRKSDGVVSWVGRNEDPQESQQDEAMVDRLLETGRAFVAAKGDLVTESFDENQFLEGLLTVILDQNTAIQDAVRNIAKNDGDILSNSAFSIKDGWQYLAASFIEWSGENAEDVFIWVSGLSGTAIVSEALVDLRTPNANQVVSPELTVYLDGPFLMELLGTSGAAARSDAKYLVETLLRLRIPVAVFTHSIEELQSNLNAVLNTAARDRRGPTAAALLYGEVQESVLQSILANPEHFIKLERVDVVNTGNESGLNRSHFSLEREQSFYASLWSHYEHEPARERDVRSVTWVMSRRRGEIRTDVLKSKHILVTRNSKLVSLAEKFVRDHLQYRKSAVPPAITVRDLAGILWLLVGNAERSELSQRQLLLSCHRARNSVPEIVSAMTNTLKGVNEKNADLLWAAAQQPKYLMLALDTAINAGQIGTEAAEQVLMAVKDDLVADERQRSIDREKKIKDKFDADVALQSIILKKTSQENEELKGENTTFLSAIRSVSQQEFDGAMKRAKRLGDVLSYAFVIIVLAIAAVPPLLDSWQWPLWAKLVVAVAVGAVGLFAGGLLGLPALRAVLRRSMYRRYVEKMERTIPSDPSSFIVPPS